MNQRNAIALTGIFIQDENESFTGFFSQFPEAISQGLSIEEAEKNLFRVLPDILYLKERMAEEDIPLEAKMNVFKKSYSYELSE